MLNPLTVIVGLSTLALAFAAGPYEITGDNVNCRSRPSIKSGVMRQYHCNHTAEVTIQCQIEGDTIKGWHLWDRCFVLDRWVKTGTTGFVAPLCNADGSPPSNPPPVKRLLNPTLKPSCTGINNAGIALVKTHAPFAPNLFNDEVGRPKLGYGHVCSNECKPSLTAEDAETLLHEDIAKHAACLWPALHQLMLNCNEWAALVSWTLDIGCGNMRDSRLVARLNAGENVSAVLQSELPKWNKGGSIEVPALTDRRAAEIKLALTPVDITADPQCGCSA
ncbi:hypothetical protein CcaverHIS002_0401830 [Cutaneotrichosporon cavernicola]|uniref:Lysozyme n=1 Tax=Cutaneotrichosporon cavernicola TaxID=279322 RepID=A0AA48L3P6_9TREE|nr:uncharacterized protein CcaverHIS019_0401780 [Cutaneotrichosporon cavernicola]BEI83579.1 hypothetical protein CcaverHIS002_0401830 [Cutaneotrichosporon cavernicola]BEI91358.1 hypothetical protein CcaverHIS019_0401780 [Cutaneotrichosporon cavernicola]BEI99131.1 hypothetical protein CcaverHIS631_0401740 [Cutaneotrichosporon cavernicola]BEJ06906.1 hypothetical protein CcaverHIS641_0401750 [Cutaneotrichosporon cavernicola]